MKKLKRVIISAITAIFISTSLLFLSINQADAATRVRGYIKKSGTYVAPHYRSTQNKTKIDNYSTKGNVNPYTGKVGTKRLR